MRILAYGLTWRRGAHQLVVGFETDAAIADQGYDANHLRDKIAEAGAEVIIPPK